MTKDTEKIEAKFQGNTIAFMIECRDRGATFRLGGPLVNQYWGGGGTKHFFLLNLYNFKNIGGGHVSPCPPPPPYSAVPRMNFEISQFETSGVDCITLI